MTYEEKYGYWEMISDYDMDTARAMIAAERWMYVATICYSAVERLLKGLIVLHTRKEAPKSDNLIFLMNRLVEHPNFSGSELCALFRTEQTEYLDRIIDITYYHINDYPFSYQKIMDRFIGRDCALEVFDKTVSVIAWLKSYAPGGGK